MNVYVLGKTFLLLARELCINAPAIGTVGPVGWGSVRVRTRGGALAPGSASHERMLQSVPGRRERGPGNKGLGDGKAPADGAGLSVMVGLYGSFTTGTTFTVGRRDCSVTVGV